MKLVLFQVINTLISSNLSNTFYLLKSEKDKDGNTIHQFKKEEKIITYTYWFDVDTSNSLKDKAEGSFPDNEGDDIQGYELVGKPITVTKQLLETTLKNSKLGLKEGDVINLYKKKQVAEKKIITKWVDVDTNKELLPQKEGSFPDKEGDDLIDEKKGTYYKLIEIRTDSDGNVTNVYKNYDTTWIDENGKPLPNKPQQKGVHEHGTVPNHTFVRTTVDKEKGLVNHVFKKNEAPKAKKTTKFITKVGDKIVPVKADVVGDNFVDGPKEITTNDGKVYVLAGEPKVDGDVKKYTYVEKTVDKTTNFVTKDSNGNYVKIADSITEKEFAKAEQEISFNGKKYKLVTHVDSKDGNTRNYIYEEVVEKPKKEETKNIEPKKDTTKKLPETGDSTLPFGIGLVGLSIAGILARFRRKSE